jgi:hypothetical protein
VKPDLRWGILTRPQVGYFEVAIGELLFTTNCVDIHLTIHARIFLKGMIPKCGKNITIVHRFTIMLHFPAVAHHKILQMKKR